MLYCTNDKCGFIGTEWYRVVFEGIEEVKYTGYPIALGFGYFFRDTENPKQFPLA